MDKDRRIAIAIAATIMAFFLIGIAGTVVAFGAFLFGKYWSSGRKAWKRMSRREGRYAIMAFICAGILILFMIVPALFYWAAAGFESGDPGTTRWIIIGFQRLIWALIVVGIGGVCFWLAIHIWRTKTNPPLKAEKKDKETKEGES